MRLKIKFETKESSWAILAAIVGFLGFQLFYFTLVIPFEKIAHASPSFALLFWVSFVVWGLLGFLGYLRKTKREIRSAQDAFLVFGLALFATIALAGLDSFLSPIPLSFPGFAVGIAANGSIVLIKRGFHGQSHSTR